ncbi:dnaJ homolog subfamily C member 4-like [Centruroides sculpturatus]|uniref:dnaJ homolog subfamily C member 4-like n=1 Tax=Centruroides sculpturatus TaxID=218467 RepID=UPI000C6CDA12|nr:dnaJ homolog subfamily C member 4-like [Centruroides sculpturatus]
MYKNLKWRSAVNGNVTSVFTGFLAKTHYEVLGINNNSTTKEVKEAYVKLCKELHPDKNPNASNQHEKFVQLNEAYVILVRPETRSRYDLSLVSKQNEASKRNCYSSSAANCTHYYRAYENDDYTKENETHHYYRNHSYSHSPPLERIKNVYIVVGCVILIISGSLIHFATFRLGMTFSEKKLDEKDKKLQSIYFDVKLNAIDGRDATKIVKMQDKLNRNKSSASLPKTDEES